MKRQCVRRHRWLCGTATALLVVGGLACAAGVRTPAASTGKARSAVDAAPRPDPNSKDILPSSGRVVLKARNMRADYDTADVYVQDSRTGESVRFATIPDVMLPLKTAYVGGQVFLVRLIGNAYEIWRYSGARKGERVYAGDVGWFEVSPSSELLAVNVEQEGIRVLWANGAGLLRVVPNATLVGEPSQQLRSVSLDGWDRSSTQLWYNVAQTVEGALIDTFGYVDVGTWQLRTYPYKRSSFQHALNANTRQVAYYRPPVGSAQQQRREPADDEQAARIQATCPVGSSPPMDLWVCDLPTGRDSRIGTTAPLGWGVLSWQDDSTVCVTQSDTGQRHLFSARNAVPPASHHQ